MAKRHSPESWNLPNVPKNARPEYAVVAWPCHRQSMKRISPEYQRRLSQYYSYRGWRGFEPLDDELAVEEACNLKVSVELIVNEGLASRGDVVRAVGVSAQDIENLTGLESGYLTPPAANIVRLQPRGSQAERPTRRG